MRLQPAQMAALDHWIKAQPQPQPTRPEAIRRLIGEKLKSKGFFSVAERGNVVARAAGASFAEKAASEQIDRLLKGTRQPPDVKAERKKRLTKIPRELRNKPKEER